MVSRNQLRRLGRSESSIAHATRAGRLLPVIRGVFAVGHAGIGARGQMMAAVLACGDGTVVSHRSAAALLGLADRAPIVVDVISAAPGRGRRIDGIRAHAVPVPTAAERGTVDGIPCTSPARTLVDMAGMVRERTLRSGFERAAANGKLDLDAVEAAARRRRRSGAPLVRTIVAEWRAATEMAPGARLRSPFEARLLPLLAGNLPPPLVNAPVQTPGGRLEVDLLWPRHRFVVEADSRRHHGTELAFERDRWRDRELMRAGYGTLRPTWQQVEREPEAVVAAIATHLNRSG